MTALQAKAKTAGRLRRGALALMLVVAAFTAAAPAFAVNPDEVLSDPKLEHRAREISAQLRCMVCQNQSIDDSNADLARDLRVLVRERLVQGDSDRKVIDYVVSRYGEFVLLKPRFTAKTYILWGAPLVLLLIGAVAMFVYTRRRPPSPADRLSADEEARLQALLADKDAG
ncbi:cytochrome c-type biogenesis protein [Rhizobium halophytocola]|uniref:Cytochrome c-type biogenesis protein n=1 Tax=Rhizobium halophytocola TaxID=735519 RepID=A0ABS4DYW7_9HYPH|nr:cytochrome c-type biogenesis protein [Rhizobium halophytocola]MBP1850884.1 cytochrome c-type biogenesis protein CcmH [Rhizobium halophytocola]